MGFRKVHRGPPSVVLFGLAKTFSDPLSFTKDSISNPFKPDEKAREFWREVGNGDRGLDMTM